jgi:hypothetical protein
MATTTRIRPLKRHFENVAKIWTPAQARRADPRADKELSGVIDIKKPSFFDMNGFGDRTFSKSVVRISLGANFDNVSNTVYK